MAQRRGQLVEETRRCLAVEEDAGRVLAPVPRPVSVLKAAMEWSMSKPCRKDGKHDLDKERVRREMYARQREVNVAFKPGPCSKFDPTHMVEQSLCNRPILTLESGEPIRSVCMPRAWNAD